MADTAIVPIGHVESREAVALAEAELLEDTAEGGAALEYL